jgi:monoamine oxidase
MSFHSYQIGIAGAGIAGLVAGTELLRAGHAVSIFESRSRTGGRIQSLDVSGFLVESGPEFIHGNLKGTFGLLKKYNLPFEPVQGKMFQARNGELTETFEMAEGWNLLLEKMKSLKQDLTLLEFLMQYFPGDRFSMLRKSAIRFAEGFDLADVEKASTLALLEEWEKEEDGQYRIQKGYGTLIRALENDFLDNGGKLYLNHQVKSVDWSSGFVGILVNDRSVFRMEKLVVCLPLPALSHAAPPAEIIHFSPALENKTEAFRRIGYGTVIKIILIWNEAFWKPRIPDALFIFSDTFIPTWWTRYPQDLPLLTGWLGGPQAKQVSDKSDEYLLEQALESLSKIFTISPEALKLKLKDFRIFNWKNEPWSRGAYSYALVGTDAAKNTYRQPVENRIYFAGEACYQGPYPGTVEAAVISGLTVSGLILEEITEK